MQMTTCWIEVGTEYNQLMAFVKDLALFTFQMYLSSSQKLSYSQEENQDPFLQLVTESLGLTW